MRKKLKKKKKKQPCLWHLEKALQASKDDDDTPVVRVVGDGTMETKVSGVEGGTVSRSPQELAIENAWIVCVGHNKGFHSIKVWWNIQEQHRRMVEDLEKRWERLKRSRDLRRHLRSQCCYDVPQIGGALACFLSPLHTEIKDRKEVEGVDKQK